MRCWTVWPSKATSEQCRLIQPSDFQDVLVGFGFFDCLFTLHVLTQYFHKSLTTCALCKLFYALGFLSRVEPGGVLSFPMA